MKSRVFIVLQLTALFFSLPCLSESWSDAKKSAKESTKNVFSKNNDDNEVLTCIYGDNGNYKTITPKPNKSSSSHVNATCPPDTKGLDHNGWHQWGGNVDASIADYSDANKNKVIVTAQNLGDKGGSATYNPHDNSLTITDAKDQSAKNYVDYCNQPSGQFNNRWEETAAGLRGDSGVNSHNAACILDSTLRFCNTATGLCDTWKITETKNGEIKAIKKPKQKLADVEKMEEKAIQREEKKESQKKNSDKKSNQVSTKKSKQTQSTQSKKTTKNTTQPNNLAQTQSTQPKKTTTNTTQPNNPAQTQSSQPENTTPTKTKPNNPAQTVSIDFSTMESCLEQQISIVRGLLNSGEEATYEQISKFNSLMNQYNSEKANIQNKINSISNSSERSAAQNKFNDIESRKKSVLFPLCQQGARSHQWRFMPY